jgi:hypothetical protein
MAESALLAQDIVFSYGRLQVLARAVFLGDGKATQPHRPRPAARPATNRRSAEPAG